MKKIIKFALPLIACLAIAIGVMSMNGTFSNANDPDGPFTVSIYTGRDEVEYFENLDNPSDHNEKDEDFYYVIDNVPAGNFELPVCKYLTEDRVFIGYGTSNDNDSLITTDSINITGDTVLYALWDQFEIIEQPSASNGYKVVTNVSPLTCSDQTAGLYLLMKNEGEFQLKDDYNEYFAIASPLLEKDTIVKLKISNVEDIDEVHICDAEDDDDYSDDRYYCANDGDITDTITYVVQNDTYGLYIYVYCYNDTTSTVEITLEDSSTSLYVYDMCEGCDDNVISLECDINDVQLRDLEVGRKYIGGIEFANGFDKGWSSYLDADIYEFTFGAVQKSSSKKYKAKTTTDSGEKISGSGKKNSTRTITPVEGKKVKDVIVTDKDGNVIDVTLNEDGTYSFKQPASNVDVQIVYQNREIKLEIGSPNIDVDGEVTNTGVKPIVRDNRTMLPIRFVAENLGAKVGWEEKNPNVVTISKGDTTIVIHLGSNKVEVNGKELEIDAVAFAENDRTYLPVRFISEQLNADVKWDEQNPSEIIITEK